MSDRHEIIDVINRYCEACDTKNWDGFGDVFVADAVATYGGVDYEGVDAIAGLIASRLGRCGATQHLVSNYQITIDPGGQTASARCKLRAWHAGVGGHAESVYEVFGSYIDRFVRTPEGWRMTHRVLQVDASLGSREMFLGE